MSPPVRDSTTKLENVSQYATLLGYCSRKICPAKFSKTKFPCKSRRHGKQTFFFAYWVSRLCLGLYACTMPLNSSLQVVRFCIYRLYANTKAEFRGLQIFSKMQSPKSLSLAVLLGGYLSRISHLCNLSNHVVHIDSLSAGQSAPPTAIVLLDNNLSLSFQSFRQPAIDQPPLHDLTRKGIDIFFRQ